MAIPKSDNALDVLQQMFNDVLVQTGKVLKASSRDSKGNLVRVDAMVKNRILPSAETFHDALDDLESEIVRAKSVLLRDLAQLRAKRAAPVPAAEPKAMPIAPPAPMAFDLDTPELDVASAPSAMAPPTGAAAPVKMENRPVAPFPNMGLDLTASPEVVAAAAPAPAPAPGPVPAATMAKPNQEKPSPNLAAAQAAVVTGRPFNAAPKREPNPAARQPPRPAASTTPQSPASAAIAPAASSLAAPLSVPQTSGPNPATAPPMSEPELAFTDMAFSLVPAVNETPQAQPVAPQPDMDLGSFGTADMSGDLLDLDSFGAEPGPGTNEAVQQAAAPMPPEGGAAGRAEGGEQGEQGNMSNLDAEIDTLYHSNMDYDLGGIGMDTNNSFDDMFFGSGDDNAGESNDTYFGFIS